MCRVGRERRRVKGGYTHGTCAHSRGVLVSQGYQKNESVFLILSTAFIISDHPLCPRSRIQTGPWDLGLGASVSPEVLGLGSLDDLASQKC
jgi:hypothetical protein